MSESKQSEPQSAAQKQQSKKAIPPQNTAIEPSVIEISPPLGQSQATNKTQNNLSIINQTENQLPSLHSQREGHIQNQHKKAIQENHKSPNVTNKSIDENLNEKMTKINETGQPKTENSSTKIHSTEAKTGINKKTQSKVQQTPSQVQTPFNKVQVPSQQKNQPKDLKQPPNKIQTTQNKKQLVTQKQHQIAPKATQQIQNQPTNETHQGNTTENKKDDKKNQLQNKKTSQQKNQPKQERKDQPTTKEQIPSQSLPQKVTRKDQIQKSKQSQMPNKQILQKNQQSLEKNSNQDVKKSSTSNDKKEQEKKQVKSLKPLNEEQKDQSRVSKDIQSPQTKLDSNLSDRKIEEEKHKVQIPLKIQQQNDQKSHKQVQKVSIQDRNQNKTKTLDDASILPVVESKDQKKDVKDSKDQKKEVKDSKDQKKEVKDSKDQKKEVKDSKDQKKDVKDSKDQKKDVKDSKDQKSKQKQDKTDNSLTWNDLLKCMLKNFENIKDDKNKSIGGQNETIRNKMIDLSLQLEANKPQLIDELHNRVKLELSLLEKLPGSILHKSNHQSEKKTQTFPQQQNKQRRQEEAKQVNRPQLIKQIKSGISSPIRLSFSLYNFSSKSNQDADKSKKQLESQSNKMKNLESKLSQIAASFSQDHCSFSISETNQQNSLRQNAISEKPTSLSSKRKAPSTIINFTFDSGKIVSLFGIERELVEQLNHILESTENKGVGNKEIHYVNQKHPYTNFVSYVELLIASPLKSIESVKFLQFLLGGFKLKLLSEDLLNQYQTYPAQIKETLHSIILSLLPNELSQYLQSISIGKGMIKFRSIENLTKLLTKLGINELVSQTPTVKQLLKQLISHLKGLFIADKKESPENKVQQPKEKGLKDKQSLVRLWELFQTIFACTDTHGLAIQLTLLEKLRLKLTIQSPSQKISQLYHQVINS